MEICTRVVLYLCKLCVITLLHFVHVLRLFCVSLFSDLCNCIAFYCDHVLCTRHEQTAYLLTEWVSEKVKRRMTVDGRLTKRCRCRCHHHDIYSLTPTRLRFPSNEDTRRQMSYIQRGEVFCRRISCGVCTADNDRQSLAGSTTQLTSCHFSARSVEPSRLNMLTDKCRFCAR